MGPSAGWGELVSPVAAGGVDGVFAEDLAGVEVDDGDGGFVGDGEDAFAGVSSSDAEVVHAAGAADADASVGVDEEPRSWSEFSPRLGRLLCAPQHRVDDSGRTVSGAG